MPGPPGRNPDEVFDNFCRHLGRLLNQTVTDAPLSVLKLTGAPEPRALVSFRRGDAAIAAPLRSHDLFLYIGQLVTVVPQQGDTPWRLKTLTYRYWVQGDDDQNTDSWYFRFEYISPQIRQLEHPRHHVHIPANIACGGCGDIDLRRTHVPTGWVTVEEVIRFLVEELGVRSRARNWPRLCAESEELFRHWTARTVP